MNRPVIICILIITASTFGAFFPVGSAHYVDYDDPAYITQNLYVNSGIDIENLQWAATLTQPKGTPTYSGISNLYHPLTWFSHMLDVELFGVEHPQMHHWVNLGIHIIAAILCFLFLRKLLNDTWLALFAALLFGLHPLHVESVAWISARKDTLSGMFFFATLLSYLYAKQSGPHLTKTLSVSCFILALLAKPSVVILPVLLILLDYFSEQKTPKFDVLYLKKQLWSKLPWIFPAIVIALITVTLQAQGSHSYFIETNSASARISAIPAQLTYYIYRTFVPVNLSFHYSALDFPPSVTLSSSIIFWASLLYFSYQYRESFKTFGFATLWFLLCILPMSGIVYVGTIYTADRYTYLAILGIFVVIGSILKKHLSKLGFHVALLIISATCIFLSNKQTRVWKNSYSLFNHAIVAQPRDPLAYVNLAARYQHDGSPKKAIPLLEKALTLNPQNYTALYNLGIIYEEVEGDSLKALDYFEQSLRIYPEHLPSLQKLSNLLERQQTHQSFTQAIEFTTQYNQLTSYHDPQFVLKEIRLNIALKNIPAAQKAALKFQEIPNIPQSQKAEILQTLRLTSTQKLDS